MTLPQGTASVWSEYCTADASLDRTEFGAFSAHADATFARDGQLDVIIIGGGISGLTTGLLLQRSGIRTAVLEQHRIACGESSRTSAHLTEYPDAGFARITTDFGVDGARAVACAQREAMEFIAAIAGEVPCDFERVSGFLYTEREADREQLSDELDAARAAGCTARPINRAPLPFATAGAIEFPHQAQFHPTKYLAGLLQLYVAAGGYVAEGAHVRGVDEDMGRCRVRTDRWVTYVDRVIAVTDAPITSGGLLDTKLRANRSYVLAVRVAPQHLPNGLFWDTDEPYHYIRTASTASGRVAIIGGGDHRTGTDGETEAIDRLERYARQRFPTADVVQRWSGQIMEPVDGLPYIGPRESGSRVLLATGYAGNGLTFGTAAAHILCDIIRGVPNSYAELFAPNRMLAARQWAKYAAQNLPAAWTLVSDMLPHPRASSLDDLKAGEGRVVRINGEKVAASRDREGILHLVSPTCTHMGCDVAWNTVEQTWDCPCHGSRYNADGHVIHGPATRPLELLGALAGAGTDRSKPNGSR